MNRCQDAVMITATDLTHLRRCIELADEALNAGDQPFGSVLVDATGAVLREERNHVGGGDQTRHPEFALARWAASEMTPEQRAAAVVYTSGEHCPMCAAAHAWVGLGRIVYVASGAQFAGWLESWGVGRSPLNTLPINAIAPNIPVEGPVPELVDAIHAIHERCWAKPASRPDQTPA